jgi:hypothetical protein
MKSLGGIATMANGECGPASVISRIERLRGMMCGGNRVTDLDH